jgi:hypothetical protein
MAENHENQVRSEKTRGELPKWSPIVIVVLGMIMVAMLTLALLVTVR